MEPWISYLDLPYQLGAHPDSGASDCVNICQAVLRDAGRPLMPLRQEHYEAFRSGNFAWLLDQVLSASVDGRGELYDVGLIPLGDRPLAVSGFGFGIRVAAGILTTGKSRGSLVLHPSEVAIFGWRRFE